MSSCPSSASEQIAISKALGGASQSKLGGDSGPMAWLSECPHLAGVGDTFLAGVERREAKFKFIARASERLRRKRRGKQAAFCRHLLQPLPFTRYEGGFVCLIWIFQKPGRDPR